MNKNLIKFIFLLSYSTFFVQSINAVTSPDFIAYSKEGTALKFRIKNESTKVCALYGEHENKKVMVTSSGAVYRDYYYTCCEEIGEHLTIPEIVNGYTVTSIDNWAFYGRTITSITIPQTIAYIGKDAFSMATIKKAYIDCNVDGSFQYDLSESNKLDLQEVIIGKNVSSIAAGAFANFLHSSQSLSFNNYVYKVPSLIKLSVDSENPFFDSRDNCNAIIETTSNKLIQGCPTTVIPNTVKEIGEKAFYHCEKMTSVTLPSSVTTIGSDAFSSCNGLTSVHISDIATWCNITFGNVFANPLYYAKHLYLEDEEITELCIPESVICIKNYAFSGCSGLTSITIPNSVTTIGNSAFQNCSGLTSITIPSSVTSIGYSAFFSCNGLTSVHISDIATWCNITFGNDFANPLYYAKHLYLEDEEITELCIPESVICIKNYAFSGCSGLTSITIPNSVTTIGNSAFQNCSGLTSITIPNSVTTIGNSAFQNCSGLTSITIPSSVTSIGNSAFRDCSDLTSITIPNSVTSIGNSAFSGCNKLSLSTFPGSYAFLWAYSQGLSGTEAFEKAYIHTASSIRLEFFPFADNVSVSSVKVDGTKVPLEEDAIKLLGLQPNKEYNMQYSFTTVNSRISIQKTYTTYPLTLTTEQPKVISVGNVIVSAQSNLDDAEENVGFEWRRTDWTDDFASNTGEAYLFDGMMEGYIRNLYAEKLWKYRPYYEAGDGTRYYGDWVGIDPTNTSYFEPTVHTYASVVVDGSTAAVKGYVQRGTDDVAEQGFAYWKTEAGAKGREDARRISSIPDDATTVVARGKVMTATLTGLEAGTEYTYVAYVVTDEGETFYGEEQTFRTDVATGIEETTAEPVLRAVPQGVYNLSGQRLTQPQKGLNIINGKKVLIK